MFLTGLHYLVNIPFRFGYTPLV